MDGDSAIVSGISGVGRVVAIVVSGSRRARVQIWIVPFAPEAGQEKGIARAEVVGADAGALEAAGSFGDHFADAASFFCAGDAEKASL